MGEKINSYEVVSKIGEGGMGSVYLGKHSTINRMVAIKILREEFLRDEQIRERFINEAKTLSQLSHSNIVMLYDFMDHKSGLVLIMEYVEGISGDALIKKFPAGVPQELCVKYSLQILNGFLYAHSRGIVHRDIKPSNFIINKEGTIKILDFGIAKILKGDVNITKAGTKMGSLMYMSPEQITGRSVDIRTDIYSLGVTLYQMLTGCLPYEAMNSEYEIQNSIINTKLPVLNSSINCCADEFNLIIQKATAKDPSERFQNCNEFITALNKIERYNPQDNKPAAYINNKTQIVNPGSPKKRSNAIIYISTLSIVLIAVIVLSIMVFRGTESGASDNTVSKSIEAKSTQDKTNDLINTSNKAEEREITLTVDEILNAWQNKDIQGFFSHLTNDYEYQSSDGIHRTYSERKNKAYQIFAANSYISMKKNNLQVEINGNEAVAKFEQVYNSTTVNEKTVKKFYFRKESGKWMMYKELSGFH